jgi:aspartyl-tRNA(Asn)/glutamyl-tRNA(Gln) amidotransferase subunit C
MKKLTSEEVVHIAKLAKLKLSDEEIKKFQKQLSCIIVFVDELKKINTNNVVPTAQVTGLNNVFRDDVVIPSLSQEQALSNAQETYKGFFKVKSILE